MAVTGIEVLNRCLDTLRDLLDSNVTRRVWLSGLPGNAATEAPIARNNRAKFRSKLLWPIARL